MVDLDPLDEQDELRITHLLKKHLQLTESSVAKFLLDDWATQSAHFIKVFPKEYKAVLMNKSNKLKIS